MMPMYVTSRGAGWDSSPRNATSGVHRRFDLSDLWRLFDGLLNFIESGRLLLLDALDTLFRLLSKLAQELFKLVLDL